MSSEPDDLSARLAAIEASTGKRKARARPSLFTALLGSVAILTVGGLGWMLMQPKSEPSMPTAAAEEFQTAGSGFGEFPRTPAPEPAPAPAPVPEGPSAAELELREALARLQSELEELRARPVETGDPGAQAAITDLTAQMAALEASSAEARAALERQLVERDRELERIRMDLEIARLGPQGEGEEDARLAELERRRAAEAAAREARVNSPMLAWSGMGGGAEGETAVEAARLSPDEAFVRGGAAPAPVTRAELIVNPGHTVVQGTMIQAVLETAMDSTLPGVIRAVVSEDVHSFDGTRVLIPRGAQLIGRYRSEVSLAQSRVMVGWDRIILPDNQTVAISAFGGDELGRSGVTGDVDTRFGQRFGSAALISLIGAVPAAAAASIDGETTSEAASDVAGDLRDASRSVMQDYLSIRPVIRVPQGTRITVMVDHDLEIL
ncbi:MULTISPECIES: TrbI/VirB10 family protein [Paracoccaceae]|uniref:TrbI/VirB10 family protein n=1 Tax=Paracoccaceae TaxID=31989 RepID=UPI001574E00F|nr:MULTISPECIES: TrbI/VirB10 family protein [Paracoccaceae]MBJ2153520.1 TrbI/VirB10 family protein [Paracoccus sp. IB05]NTT88282.1 TrbI/VirB10 family protein [Tabrizicola sp. SY72]